MACSMRNIGIFEFISLTNDGRLTFTDYEIGFIGATINYIQIYTGLLWLSSIKHTDIFHGQNDG